MKEKEVSQGCKCDGQREQTSIKYATVEKNIYINKKKDGNFDEPSINVHEKNLF